MVVACVWAGVWIVSGKTENKNRLTLWEEAVKDAFPCVDDSNGEKTYWRVTHLHDLRNRVSHMDSLLNEVPRVLFLGICLDFHYFSTGVVFPKFGFDFSWGAVAQALVEP